MKRIWLLVAVSMLAIAAGAWWLAEDGDEEQHPTFTTNTAVMPYRGTRDDSTQQIDLDAQDIAAKAPGLAHALDRALATQEPQLLKGEDEDAAWEYIESFHGTQRPAVVHYRGQDFFVVRVAS